MRQERTTGQRPCFEAVAHASEQRGTQPEEQRERRGGAGRHAAGGEREANACVAGDLEKRGSGRPGHRRRPHRLEPCWRSRWEGRIYAVAGPAPRVVVLVPHRHVVGAGSFLAWVKNCSNSRMGATLILLQEWGLEGEFGCPPQIGGSSRGSAEAAFFLLGHPYFAMGA
jgi:hypothetical protein